MMQKSMIRFGQKMCSRFESGCHAMYCAALKCSPSFYRAGERVVMAYSMSLHNIGNTCWFNSVIQAISCISKKKDEIFETITNSCAKKYQDVSDLLLSIVQRRNISEEKMASIIHSVCDHCHFTFGQQNDPEEFFVLWKLPKYLSELDFPCEIKWKMSYQC